MEGLKGGAIIYIVGGLDKFVKDAISENINFYITSKKKKLDYSKFSTSFTKNIVNETFRIGHNIKPYYLEEIGMTKSEFLIYLANNLTNKFINFESIVLHGQLPSSDYIKEVGDRLLINNLYPRLRVKMERRMGIPLVPTYIQDKLVEILRIRNRVAHGSSLGSVSTRDVMSYIAFCNQLSKLLDIEFRTAIRSIVQNFPLKEKRVKP
jgi:hypothetical protein